MKNEIKYNGSMVSRQIDTLTSEYAAYCEKYGNIGDNPITTDGMVGPIKMFEPKTINDDERKRRANQYTTRVLALLNELEIE